MLIPKTHILRIDLIKYVENIIAITIDDNIHRHNNRKQNFPHI